MRYIYIAFLLAVCSTYVMSDASMWGKDDDDEKWNNGHGNGNGYGHDKDDDDGNNGYGGGKPDNNNYLEVNTNSNLSFTCNDPKDLESVQTIYNAISLKFKTKNNDCSIYAKISSYNYPYGASPSNIPIELDYTSDNSPNAQNLLRDPVQLSYYDQRLFVQPQRSQTFHFYYDLRLQALGYDYPPGKYDFTILFTMTQP